PGDAGDEMGPSANPLAPRAAPGSAQSIAEARTQARASVIKHARDGSQGHESAMEGRLKTSKPLPSRDALAPLLPTRESKGRGKPMRTDPDSLAAAFGGQAEPSRGRTRDPRLDLPPGSPGSLSAKQKSRARKGR
ncbi:MAG: hypothetical protein JNK11_07215, partial [Alphaproteobacteria bacterium]|nr:hypothetical protein [Alphaproteobacteria bacterium]